MKKAKVRTLITEGFALSSPTRKESPSSFASFEGLPEQRTEIRSGPECSE